MTYEQIENLLTPLIVATWLILIVLVFILILTIGIAFNQEDAKKYKAKANDLEERLKNKEMMDRLRYEHEQLMKEYREKEKQK